MQEIYKDACQTLEWIINESEYGFYLVVADENTQQEIADVYCLDNVEIYDYKQYPGGYSFSKLEQKLETVPGNRVVFLQNFHEAIQNKEDIYRVNFCRDMLARMKRNIIFFTTIEGDDVLAREAFDFYSFIKLRILFPNYFE